MGLGLNPGTTSYCVTLYNHSTSLSISFLNCKRKVTSLHEVIAQMRQNVDDFSPSIQIQTELGLIILLGLGPRSELERWRKVGASSCGHHIIILSLIKQLFPAPGAAK